MLIMRAASRAGGKQRSRRGGWHSASAVLLAAARVMLSCRPCIWSSAMGNVETIAFSERSARKPVVCWCGHDAGITCRTFSLVRTVGKRLGFLAYTNSQMQVFSVLQAQCLSCIASRTWSSRVSGCRVTRVSSNPDSLVQRNDDTLFVGSATECCWSAMQRGTGIGGILGLLQSFSSRFPRKCAYTAKFCRGMCYTAFWLFLASIGFGRICQPWCCRQPGKLVRRVLVSLGNDFASS